MMTNTTTQTTTTFSQLCQGDRITCDLDGDGNRENFKVYKLTNTAAICMDRTGALMAIPATDVADVVVGWW